MAFCPEIDPILPSDPDHKIEDIAFDLASAASGLAAQLHPVVRLAVGDLVRSMNCYYSNLIEGHNTVPRDIERALAHDYALDPVRRNLQLEAVAHIAIQGKIDHGQDPAVDPVSPAYLRWLHREFCTRLPPELLWIDNPDTGERAHVVPGEIRARTVKIGFHVPPDGETLHDCLERFGQVYSGSFSRSQRIIAVAAAHHRVLWIHPFVDGNGRVARLMAHSMLRRLNVGNSLWSVSRGLARNVAEYKSLLMAADRPRAHDYDGRGPLSDRALFEFCSFFLRICLDQIRFMQSLLDPAELLRRLELFCRDESAAGRLSAHAWPVLREAVLRGAIERGGVSALTGLRERAARNVASALISKGLLTSETPKGPLQLGFPAEAVERWFPSLYPATTR